MRPALGRVRGLRPRLRLRRAARARAAAARRLGRRRRRRRARQRLLRTLDAGARRPSASGSRPPARRSVQEYRELAGPDEPRILLLIDGYPAVQDRSGRSHAGRGPFYAIFMRILGEGRPLGVHAVVTADRCGAVPSAVSANVSQRIVLRMSDDEPLHALGAPRDVLDERSPRPDAPSSTASRRRSRCSAAPSNVAEQTKALSSSPAIACARRSARGLPRSARCRPMFADGRHARPGRRACRCSASPTTRSRPRVRAGSAPSWWPVRRRAARRTPCDALVRSMATLRSRRGALPLRRPPRGAQGFPPWVRSGHEHRGRKALATELAERGRRRVGPGPHHDRGRGRDAVRDTAPSGR